MVTEAVQQVLGDRVVGICDSPSGLARVAARARPRPEQMWFDYFGLNHLGWLRGVHDGERDLLPGSGRRHDARRLRGGPLFGGDWLRALGMIPNEYLYYFYSRRDGRRSGRAAARRVPARAQAAFYARQRRDPPRR